MDLLLEAYAKTNLSLRITGKRDDGFHELHTFMTLVSLADRLEFDRLPAGSGVRLKVDGADWKPRAGDVNLVESACRVFAERTGHAVDLGIRLHKHIPSGAGLGGGSSDAAATLRALDTLNGGTTERDQLFAMGETLGSDVCFFLEGKMAECTGRGERVVPVADDWELPIVLLKPAFSVSTADAYGRLDGARELAGVPYVPQICPWGEMVNDLERPVFEKYPLLAEMKNWLLDQPEVHAALLSGSGSTMLAVLNKHMGGEQLADRARATFGTSLWTHVGQTLSCPP